LSLYSFVVSEINEITETSEITCENQSIFDKITLMKSPEITYENIVFKIHTFLFTFKIILIK